MGAPRHVRRPFTCLAVVLALLLVGAGCSDDGDGDDAGGPTTTTSAGGGATDEGQLTVLTYNVAGLPQEISKENPKENLPKISPLLEDYDVVLTQEDFDWWLPGSLADGLDFNQYHERLRADTTHEYATPVHPGYEAVGIDLADRPDMAIGDGIGILSRYPLTDFEVVPWTDCFGGFTEGASDCLAMKGFRVATMDVGGAEVDVYSLHGEAGGTPEDQALQPEDYEQLAAYIDEHSDGRAVIVGGDTNLHIDEEHEDSGDGADATIWADFLEATGLTDVCAATDCDDPGIIDKVAIRDGEGIALTADEWASPVGPLQRRGRRAAQRPLARRRHHRLVDHALTRRGTATPRVAEQP